MKVELFYHFVLVTKYRKKVLNEQRMEFVINDIRNLCKKFNYELLEIGGDLEDHVHFVLGLTSSHSVSSVIQIIKSFTTVNAWREYPELRKYYWYKNHLWSNGYFCQTFGKNSYEKVIQYVKDQGTNPHP